MRLEIKCNGKSCEQIMEGTGTEILGMLAGATELILGHLANDTGNSKSVLKAIYLSGLFRGDDDVKEDIIDNIDCSFSNFSF